MWVIWQGFLFAHGKKHCRSMEATSRTASISSPNDCDQHLKEWLWIVQLTWLPVSFWQNPPTSMRVWSTTMSTTRKHARAEIYTFHSWYRTRYGYRDCRVQAQDGLGCRLALYSRISHKDTFLSICYTSPLRIAILKLYHLGSWPPRVCSRKRSAAINTNKSSTYT